MAFMHGAQDGQKFMGIFMLAIFLGQGKGYISNFTIPIWMMVLCSFVMAYALDTVLNNIEDILIQMDMYQIESVPVEMISLVELIEDSSHKLSDIMKELYNFKNPEKLLLMDEEIINLEDEGDVIYYQAIKNLHIGKVDLYKSYRYSKIYDVFEVSIDSFEDLANVVEAIILKNT